MLTVVVNLLSLYCAANTDKEVYRVGKGQAGRLFFNVFTEKSVVKENDKCSIGVYNPPAEI